MFGFVSRAEHESACAQLRAERQAALDNCRDREAECARLTGELTSVSARLADAERDLKERTEELIEALQSRTVAPKPAEPAAGGGPVTLTGEEIVTRAEQHRNKVARRKS